MRNLKRSGMLFALVALPWLGVGACNGEDGDDSSETGAEGSNGSGGVDGSGSGGSEAGDSEGGSSGGSGSDAGATSAGDGDGDAGTSQGDGDGDTQGDGDGDTQGDGDGDGDTTEDSGGEGGFCDDGLTWCDGECVDTQTSDDHCGGCGQKCEVVQLGIDTFGACKEGMCEPTIYECAGAEGPSEGHFADCNEYCEYYGESCAYKGCTGITGVAFASYGNCIDSIAQEGYSGTCEASLEIVNGIRCCCTQSFD